MVYDLETDKRQRFHVVQLAMFNADVLASVQREADTNANGTCRKVIDQSAQRNVAAAPPVPSTVNQSLFFGMAYLALVWLRESMSNEEVERALSSQMMEGVWDAARPAGPRDITSDKQKMRLVRNALSHGNVRIEAPFDFVFWDQNKFGKAKEESPTFLRMSSGDLGRLSSQFYYAASDVIYS